MKPIIAFLLCTIAAMAIAAPANSDKNEKVNVDEILSNRRLLIPYVKCALEQGKCSPSGKDLKGKEIGNKLT